MAETNFIHSIIEKDLENQKYGDKVYTRFPPEPNGYLHIGHAKSICLNFSTAAKYGGKCNLRYDDTNPVREDDEYVQSILEDLRWLGAEPRALASSRYTRAFTNENARLSRKTKLRAAIESSVLCRIYRAVLRCGQNSRILSWLFSGGVTGLILVCIGLYAGIDYVLRDLLAIPVLSSMWDEALLLFAALWICGQRVEARSPLAARTTPMDCGILLFLTAGFVLMNVNAPFFSIQVSGFRASCQYLLWFFIVTRILRDDRDVMRL